MYLDQAIKKIEQGLKECGTVQGGDFPACMAAVAKGAGDALSDLEAYRRAVSFYFPGALVDMSLSIRMSEYEPSKETTDTDQTGILLSLADFL